MREAKATSIIGETLPVLILMALAGTIAGLFLSAARSSLDAFPGLLVLVPAMQNLRGSISGSFASRLSTALHRGTVLPTFRGNPELPSYVVASLVISALMSLIAGLGAFLFSMMFGIRALGIMGMVTVSMSVGVLAGTIHLILNLGVSITSYRNGLDPDNISIPSLAIFGDIVTLFCFLMMIRVVT